MRGAHLSHRVSRPASQLWLSLSGVVLQLHGQCNGGPAVPHCILRPAERLCANGAPFFSLQHCLDIKATECNDNVSALHLVSIEALKFDNMDDFTRSCSNAEQYPRNLLASSAPVYTLRAIEDQLSQRSDQLFCDEALASSKLRPSLSLFEGSAEGVKSRYFMIAGLKLT